MSPTDKIIRDIESLQESMRHDWQDLGKLDLNASERKNVRKHMKWCAAQLNFLVAQLEILDSNET